MHLCFRPGDIVRAQVVSFVLEVLLFFFLKIVCKFTFIVVLQEIVLHANP